MKDSKPIITALYMASDVMRAVWVTEQLEAIERQHQVYSIATTPILLLRSPLKVQICRMDCTSDDVRASLVSATLGNRIRCTNGVGHE
jgi:hypothetical protein